MIVAEIGRCFGGNLKAGAVSQHFNRNIKPNVKLIQDALARGEDPIGATLLENVRTGQSGKGQTAFQLPSCTIHVFLLSECLL